MPGFFGNSRVPKAGVGPRVLYRDFTCIPGVTGGHLDSPLRDISVRASTVVQLGYLGVDSPLFASFL